MISPKGRKRLFTLTFRKNLLPGFIDVVAGYQRQIYILIKQAFKIVSVNNQS
jgi:hypothetical protein